MPEFFSHDESSNLMRIRLYGADSIEDWQASRARVLSVHLETGINRLLVDAREQDVVPGIFDVFDFARSLPHHIRIALVTGNKNREALEFLETVAVNRMKQLCLFDDEHDALVWLDD